MWIRTKDKMINSRHLAEMKISQQKMTNGTVMHELTACPARKENQPSILYRHTNRDLVNDVLVKIAIALEKGQLEFSLPDWN